MSVEALKKAHAIRGMKPSPKQLLVHLCRVHQWGKPLVQTHQQLADATCLSKRTICRHLDHLEGRGYLRRRPAKEQGKCHLTEFQLAFLDTDKGAKPLQVPVPNWRPKPRQNGAPINIGVTNPSFSPSAGIPVDVRLEPELYRMCFQLIGVYDWSDRAATTPIATFLESVVENARLQLAARVSELELALRPQRVE